MSNRYSINAELELWGKYLVNGVFKNIETFLRILAIHPVPYEYQGSFSALRRLKNDHKSTMIENRPNGLII